MDYLSSKKSFVHRDLAARNILVSGDHICKVSQNILTTALQSFRGKKSLHKNKTNNVLAIDCQSQIIPSLNLKDFSCKRYCHEININ